MKKYGKVSANDGSVPGGDQTGLRREVIHRGLLH